MTDDIIDIPTTRALIQRDRSAVLLMPVMDVQTALTRLEEFQSFCAKYLQESADGGLDGGDYGIIPGTKKRTLLKSGAEKLCEIYGLADEYQIMTQVENWETGLFDYTLKCVLKSRRDDSVVGTGMGSCSSWESKYRWREQQKTCPVCGAIAIIKGKAEYGGGWLCWKKKGGCDAKFKDGDAVIESQPVGRIDNPDIIDTKNTVLKMAKKRAKVDAVIGVTRSSGIFTQDMEDAPAPAVRVAAPEPASHAPAPAQPQPRNSPGPEAQTPSPVKSALISEAQSKRFYAIAKSGGWTNDNDLKDWLLTKHGFASSKDITRAKYELICSQAQQGPPPAQANADLTADEIPF